MNTVAGHSSGRYPRFTAFLCMLLAVFWSASVEAATWHSTAFTSSGTWTNTGSVSYVAVLLVGGGGGGGASTGACTGGYTETGGGGGGGAVLWYPYLVGITGNLTVNIGAGGTNSGSYGSGTSGGNSTIVQNGTTLLTANGGGGGGAPGNQPPAIGGTPGNSNASYGHPGLFLGSCSTTTYTCLGTCDSQGGASYGPGTTGAGAANSGSGGAGQSSAPALGYAGGSGYAVIWAYY